ALAPRVGDARGDGLGRHDLAGQSGHDRGIARAADLDPGRSRRLRVRNPDARMTGQRASAVDNPPFFPPQRYDDPAAALAQVVAIHEAGVAWLREAVQRFVAGQDPSHRVHAFYPFVRIRTETVARADSRLSYGFVAGPGTYETTLTRPDLFGRYYLEQFRLLVANHQVPIEVGTGKTPIPVHFAMAGQGHIEGSIDAARRGLMRDLFDLPDLGAMDDGIANGTWVPRAG